MITRRGSIALLIVSFLALITAAYSGVASQQYARCQANWNEQSALATRERAEAADQDRNTDRAESEATKTLILTVFAAKSPEQARAAFVTYEEAQRRIDAARAAAEQQRRENPMPPLPSETCG